LYSIPDDEHLFFRNMSKTHHTYAARDTPRDRPYNKCTRTLKITHPERGDYHAKHSAPGHHNSQRTSPSLLTHLTME